MTALIRLPALFLLLPMAACEPGSPTALDGGYTFGGGNKVELVADSDTGGGAIGSGIAQSTTDSRGGHGYGSGSGTAGEAACNRETDSGGWTIGSGGGAPGAVPCEVR